MSKAQKWLLAWGVCFVGAAALVSRITLEPATSIAVGAVEVALAIATGIAFGLAAGPRDV